MRFAGIVLLKMLLLADVVSGADITNNNFKITRSPLSESLSQQTVRQTFQDDAGLLWFLTQEGLHRYDGYEVRLYQASDQAQNNISHNNVRQILQDHAGGIWIAMDGGGLNLYEPETRRFRTVPIGTGRFELLTSNVRAMTEDDSGYIWIGYLEGFISVFDPFEGSIRHLEPLNREAGTNGLITSFATDGAEHMWIGTSKGGLISYNRYTGRFIRYRAEANEADSLSSDNITALVKDDKEGLWIGTESNGLVLMNRTTGVMRRLQHRPNQT